MKNKYYLFLLIITFSRVFCFESFNLTPINFNIKWIEAKGDTTIAYGSFGSALISLDNQKSWRQSKLFETGNVIRVIIESNKITAFNDFGEICVSVDGGTKWENKNKLNDSVVYAIAYPEGYYVRTRTKILKLDSDFKIKREFPMQFRTYWKYESDFATTERNSIVYFDGNLIAESDSSVLYKFDDNLYPIDSMPYKEMGLCSSCYSFYRLFSDDEFLYTQISSGVYRTKDFKSVEKVFTIGQNYQMFKDSTYTHGFKVIGNKMFCYNKLPFFSPRFNIFQIISPDSALNVGTIDCSMPPGLYSFRLNDFTIENNKFSVCANNKFLASIELNDSVTNRISDLASINISRDFLPDMINDSTFIYYTNTAFFETKNNGATFEHLEGDSIFFPKNKSFNFKLKYFDEEEQKLFLGGHFENEPSKALVVISKDSGKTFIPKTMDKFTYIGSGMTISNLQKTNDYFIIAENARGNKLYNWLNVYDHDLNLISSRIDSNYLIYYINWKDNNNYLIFSGDSSDISKIKYTTDNGTNWATTKEFGYTIDTIWTDSVNYFTYFVTDYKGNFEKKIKDKLFLFLFSYKKFDSLFNIDAIELESKEIKKIYNYKLNKSPSFAIDCSQDTVYLAINDSLFYFTDLFDRNKWKYFVFPDSGKITNKKFKKFGDKFFALYSDNKHPINLYWLKINHDSTVSVIEDTRTEELTYLYIYPPYPVPAKNSVRSLIYWDPRIDIDDDAIGVIDVSGIKIEGKENITIDKLTPYSGFLTWNCADVAPGIYFIHIKHGNNSRIMKVIISR